jgi:hypothetical protein
LHQNLESGEEEGDNELECHQLIAFFFCYTLFFFSFLGFQCHFPFFGFHAKSRCSSSSLHVEEAAVKKKERGFGMVESN